MFNTIKEYGGDFYRLFFPRVCGGCNESLARGEEYLCLNCRLELPMTKFEMIKENPVEKIFYGRLALHYASSFLFFSKGGRVQQILHHIKYNNKQDLAVFMGSLFGSRIQQSEFFHPIDHIIPVPLHPRKMAIRGYNQSELFGRGISGVLEVPMLNQTLLRTVNTSTQTRKSRIERWENVEDVFEVKQPGRLDDKHILLVDDVLTTGATIEACAQTLLNAAGCRVSVATLAYAP